MITYCVIGKNWGSKIYKILKKKKKKAYLFNSNYRNSGRKYFQNLDNFIKKKKINIVWIATPPKNRFELINFCLNLKLNLILEKPIILSKTQIKKIKKKILIFKIFSFVHFEYIFLNKLKKISKKKINKIVFNFHHKNKNKHQIIPIMNNGSHLMALKKIYFENVKINIFNTTEGNTNSRRIEFFFNNKSKIIDFTKNKEPIIQRFINYVEKVIKYRKKNKINFEFGVNCTSDLKKLKNF